MKNYIKVAIIDVVVAIGCVILFSPGFVGLWFNDSIIWNIVLAFMMLFMFVAVVAVNAYFIMGKSGMHGKITKESDYEDEDDYRQILSDIDSPVFKSYAQTALKQMTRLQKKVYMIKVILGQFFDENEMSYKNFMIVLSSVTKAYYDNLRSMINRINIFDYDEWRTLGDKSLSCRNHIEVVGSVVGINDAIVAKVDQLLLEVSKLTDSNVKLDKMPAILDLEELIANTKYYKE